MSEKLAQSRTHRMLLALLLLSTILSACTSPPKQSEPIAEVIEVRELLDSWSGQHEILTQAKSLLDVILKDNPKDVYALKELARFYIMEGYKYANVFEPGSLENAERVLVQALGIAPNFDGSYILLGHVYELMGQLGSAEDMLTYANTLGSSDPWLHLNWAAVLKARGKNEEMRARYQMVIHSGTDNTKALSSAYGFLIRDSVESGDYDNVEIYYRKIFELSPQDAWSRGNYAGFLRNYIGDFDQAIHYARKSLDIMEYGVGNRILGLCLFAKWGALLDDGVDPEKAQKYFDEGYFYYPYLEKVVVRLGAFEKTFPTLKHLVNMGVSVNGSHMNGYTALSWAAMKGKTDLVLRLLDFGVDPDIPNIRGYTALGLAIKFGHTDTALALLKSGVSPQPGTSSVDALSIARSKNDTRVIEEIERILQF